MIASTSSHDAIPSQKGSFRAGPPEAGDNYDFKQRDGKVAITIQSARADFDEKAEVLVHLDNPEYVVEKMLQTLANRFPPESVLTIEPRDAPIRDESTTSSMKAKHDSRMLSAGSHDGKNQRPRAGDYGGYGDGRGGGAHRYGDHRDHRDHRDHGDHRDAPSRARPKRYQTSGPAQHAPREVPADQASRDRPRRVHSSRMGVRQPQDWQKEWKSSSSVASSYQRGPEHTRPHRPAHHQGYSIASSSPNVEKVSESSRLPYDDNMHRVGATASPDGHWLSPDGQRVRAIPPNSTLIGPDGQTVGRLTHDATHVSQEGLSLFGRLPNQGQLHHRDSYESVGTVDGHRHADGHPHYASMAAPTVDPNAEITVRYVEVPVIQEVIKEVKKEEIVEVEKRVPRYDIEYLEKIVEVPYVEYIDKYVEVEQVHEVTRPVVTRKVIDVPREYYSYIPKIVGEKIVEKIIEVPQMVDVPKPYIVPQPVPKAVPVTREVETLVAQTLRPVLVCDESESIEVGVRQYIPKVVCVDVYIPKPIDTPLKPLGKLRDSHRIVDVPTPQYNSLVQHLNPHLSHPNQLKGAGETMQLRHAMDGSFPVLLPHEKVSVISPKMASAYVGPTVQNLMARSGGDGGVRRRDAAGDQRVHHRLVGSTTLNKESGGLDRSGGSTEAGSVHTSSDGEAGYQEDAVYDRTKKIRKSLGGSDQPLNYNTVYQTVLDDKYPRKSRKTRNRSKSQKRHKSKAKQSKGKSTKKHHHSQEDYDSSNSSVNEDGDELSDDHRQHRASKEKLSSKQRGAHEHHRSSKKDAAAAHTRPTERGPRGDRDRSHKHTVTDVEDHYGYDKPAGRERYIESARAGAPQDDGGISSATAGSSARVDGYASTKDLPWDLPFPQPVGTVNLTIPVTLENNPTHPIARAADGTTIHVPVLKDSTKKGKKKVTAPPPLVATLTTDQYRKKLKALGAGASTISSAVHAGKPKSSMNSSAAANRQVTAPSRSTQMQQQYHSQYLPQSVPLYPSSSVPMSSGQPMSSGMHMGGMPTAGMHMGSMPMGGMPMAGMPMHMGGMPMGGMPMGGMPMGGMPMGGMPMTSMPIAAPSMLSMSGMPVMASAGMPMTSTSYV